MEKRDLLNMFCLLFIGAFLAIAFFMTIGPSDEAEYRDYQRARRDFFMERNRRDYDRGNPRDDSRDQDRRASIFSFEGDR